MNRLIYINPTAAIAAAAAVLSPFGLSACHDAKASKEPSVSSMGEDRPDEDLNRLAKSIADGDAQTFASLCSYPIVRPYPLKDIEDSSMMVDYYPIMVDSKLSERMKDTHAKDWENYGWRGWSIGEDHPIWYDEGVQFVDYLSPAEAGLKKMLADEELETLAPKYRDGWTPVMTLIQTDGTSAIRIDSSGDTYRMMLYDNTVDVSGHPSMLLLGCMHTEGTAESQIYEFNDSIGTKAEYSPDSDTADRVFFSGPKVGEKEMNVRQGYWRDVVRH